MRPPSRSGSPAGLGTKELTISVSRRGARALATATACLIAAAVPVTAALGDDTSRKPHQARAIHVTGLLTLTDADRGVYRASGDLVGTWQIPPTRATDYYNTGTTIIQKGTEFFSGCLEVGRGRCGTLNSEYISWTYLRADKRLISGGCTHAPTGGTRGFVGVRGLITMVDTPVGDEVNTVYQGELIVDAVPQEGPKRVPAEASVTTSSATASSHSSAGGSC